VPSGSGFGGAGTFPSGANYAPASDPYASSSLTSPAVVKQPASGGSILAPGIHPVPDPAAGQQPRPVNRAPQLLDPRDKTATPGDQRWAVVPAVWPAQPRGAALPPAEQSPYRVYQERSLSTPAAVNPADYEEGGWTSK
jgi:hypothetical protein